MKPAPFAYARADTLPETFHLLDRHGEGARLLAGGQSLIAALNLRLSTPDILVDIGRIRELAGIRIGGGKAWIGALTSHAQIEHSPEIRAHVPLLSQAAPHIAHPAIRNAGTLGGSLATADPAAEWPACCVALDAELVIASRSGERRVKARDFFKGVYTTALGPDEILTAVEFPVCDTAHRSVFMELAMRRGDYAIVGIAGIARKSDGRLSNVRLAYLGAGEAPVLARGAMAAAEAGCPASEVAAALDGELAPAADLYTTAPAKLHLARVLTHRALAALAA